MLSMTSAKCLCSHCGNEITNKSYMVDNGQFFHIGTGKWDADSCYNQHRLEEKTLSSLEEGMGCK